MLHHWLHDGMQVVVDLPGRIIIFLLGVALLLRKGVCVAVKCWYHCAYVEHEHKHCALRLTGFTAAYMSDTSFGPSKSRKASREPLGSASARLILPSVLRTDFCLGFH